MSMGITPPRGPPRGPPPGTFSGLPPRGPPGLPPTSGFLPRGPPSLLSMRLDRPYDPMRPYDDDEDDSGIEIPRALQMAINFKEERAEQIGIDPNTIVNFNRDESDSSAYGSSNERLQRNEAGSSDDEASKKINNKTLKKLKLRNKKKRDKKKRAKARKVQNQFQQSSGAEADNEDEGDDVDDDDEILKNVDVEFVPEKLSFDPADPNYYYFSKIFQAFKLSDELESASGLNKSVIAGGDAHMSDPKIEPVKPTSLIKDVKEKFFVEEEEKTDATDGPAKVSKRKMRLMMRPSIAELKVCCSRPDVVEWHDVTARDPKLLVHLKSARNTVPVPRHWCFKRKYLAGKRGFEKPPFDLPEFIKKTGIMEMRQALAEKEDAKTMKAKMREKVRPKLGKIDIDYQKLHDAFFRWQTKPRMSIIGDLYYEGKELEVKMRDKKPGELSDDLRTALGMPLGPNALRFPPPWLIAMQRYGPPPSYPVLKVPGLNAPIPDGCSFGYHAGGWGKPPVDETGRPLYGDVFGLEYHTQESLFGEDEIERKPWGELESSEEEEEESDMSESEEEKEQTNEAGAKKQPTDDDSGLITPATGLITPSGLSSSVTGGLETPETIEIRKKKIQQELEGGETPTLFAVLPEKQVTRVLGQMMGSTHVYDLSQTQKMVGLSKGGTEKDSSGVEVALNPEELDMAMQDQLALGAKYEEKLREQRQNKDEEDLSDMVAAHAARQNRKRKMQQESKEKKKYKEFKF